MDNPRPEKVAVVDEVRERLSSSSAALLTEYRGLKVKDLAALRHQLAGVGGEYRVYKNTLVRLAARDLGLEALDDVLVGPTAIAFVDGDAVAVAKALRDYARTNPTLVLKGGVLGRSVLSPADAGALADLPSREVLLARLAGAFAAPLQQFAALLAALPRNFAYALQALIDAGGAATDALGTAVGATALGAGFDIPDHLPQSPAPDAVATPPEDTDAAPGADAGVPDLPESPAPDATAQPTPAEIPEEQ